MVFNEVLYFQFRSNSSDLIEGSPIIEGKFRFQWPYYWTEDNYINWNLIEDISSDVQSWIDTLTENNFIPQQLIKDLSILSYMTTRFWSSAFVNEQSLFQGKKNLLLFTKFLTVAYTLDDDAEFRSGAEDHNVFVEELANLCYNILTFQYDSLEEFQSELEQSKSQLKNSNYARKTLLWYDIALELKTEYGLTKKQTKFFAWEVKNMFDYHSWCGTVDYSHLKNEKMQSYFRHYTGGPVAIMEFVFLLQGIHLTTANRKNKYWSRYILLAGKLVNNVNDVMSLKKELEANGVDSSVLIHIRNGLDITTALKKSLEDHDEALEELREIFFYLKEHKERKYNDWVGDDEYEILIQAMEICNEFVGPQIKALHMMNRYSKFDYSFV